MDLNKEENDAIKHNRAAQHGNPQEWLNWIENGENVNEKDSDGRTPLMMAARRGNVKACKLLLSHGVDPNIQNADCKTALDLIYTDTQGDLDGQGTNANLFNPNGLGRDKDGNLYFTEYDRHCIRKVTPSGQVTTIAGLCDTPGYQDGTGANARFQNPYGIVVDASNVIYITDCENHLIRKMTTAGAVTTFAGSTVGFRDGASNVAQFHNPKHMVFGASGNLFVTDYNNHRVRKIASDGTVSTFAGDGFASSADGVGTDASFYNPGGITIDANGNLYVSEPMSSCIRKVTPGAKVSLFSGECGTSAYVDGTPDDARFLMPFALAFDSEGNMLVSEFSSGSVRKIAPNGYVSTLVGSSAVGYAEGFDLNARFNQIFGIVVASQGVIYVTDVLNNRIRKLEPYKQCVVGPFTTVGSCTGSITATYPVAAKSIGDPSCTLSIASATTVIPCKNCVLGSATAVGICNGQSISVTQPTLTAASYGSPCPATSTSAACQNCVLGDATAVDTCN
ncbi:hypothetical protein EDD86DRAFT_221057, partial [Gorgonomyces haynaldii]